MKEAKLILEDGTIFEGWSFGYEQGDDHRSESADTSGEVVFCTAMTGYPESLTDPSYAGQLLVMTYPLVGNYGVPPQEKWESDRIYARSLIVSDYSAAYSHWDAQESLSDWLIRERVPAITGVDTRRLTKVLRERGVMMGRIVIGDASANATKNIEPATEYGSIKWVERVSCRSVVRYNEGGKIKVVLVDCGVKANIIRCLVNRGCEVIRVPWNYDYTEMDFDALFLGNGPGDPNLCGEAIAILKKQMERSDKPIFGICLGNQLLAKAAGANVYKLKYGHRSHNQPVRLVGENQCFITAQNHGYAVDAKTLPNDWKELFVNMNDGSNEGIQHSSKPWFSAQFHPEACSGPVDTEFLFDRFVASIKK